MSDQTHTLRQVEMLLDQIRAELKTIVSERATPEVAYSSAWIEPPAINSLDKAIMWVEDSRLHLGDEEEVT